MLEARLADRVVIAAIERGLDPDKYLRRAFAAVWEDQLDLGDRATMENLADESRLPGRHLVERSAPEEITVLYEQNRQGALAADVFGTRWRGVLVAGQDRIAGGRVEDGPRAL